MTWKEIILGYLIGTASSLSALVLEKVLTVLATCGPVFAFRLHSRELLIKLKDMPFIYKDLEAEVLSDFVEVELTTLDPSTLGSTAAGDLMSSSLESIKRRRKALFLGQAGVGKTTLFRYTILTLIGNKGRAGGGIDLGAIFHPRERLVPFYVPLKAVDNAEQYPILRYLLGNNLILEGPRGMGRLRGVAEKRRLFVLLDGYDEIPFPTIGSGEKNYISEELDLIMTGREPTGRVSDDIKHFYRALGGCRIWLSSRKSFFERYRIDVSPPSIRFRPDDFSTPVAVELRGILTKRVKLVSRIFGKYKARSATYRDILSEEYFIQEIDRSPERDLVAMSANPLFLTVMCYIYANKAIGHGRHDISWTNNLQELVSQCVDLLLEDIDAYKARGLPLAERAALLRRRNAYVSEKREFLRFFAGKLVLESKNAFDQEYLLKSAISFFETHSESGSRDEIIRELKKKDPGLLNLVDQLAFSGIFVTVDRSGGRVLYDFPHRRFREVLAAAYFDDRARLMEILKAARRDDLGEFTQFLFGQSRLKEEILGGLLKLVLRHPQDDRIGEVVRNCLRDSISDWDPSRQMGEFFLTALKTNQAFLLPIDILTYINLQEEVLQAAVNVLGTREAEASAGTDAVELAAALLWHYNPLLLRDRVATYLRSGVWDECFCVFLKYAVLLDLSLVDPYLEKIRSEGKFGKFCYIAVRSLRMRNREEVALFCWEFLRRIDLKEAATFLGMLYELDNPIFITVLRMKGISELNEVCAAVIRRMNEDSQKSGGRKDPMAGRFYVVTEALISRLEPAKSTRGIRDLRGMAYVDSRELENLPSKEKDTVNSYAGYGSDVWITIRDAMGNISYDAGDYREILK